MHGCGAHCNGSARVCTRPIEARPGASLQVMGRRITRRAPAAANATRSRNTPTPTRSWPRRSAGGSRRWSRPWCGARRSWPRGPERSPGRDHERADRRSRPLRGRRRVVPARFRAGERPSVGEYAARRPELADQIPELLPALVMVEQDLTIDPDPNGEQPPRSHLRARSDAWATTASSARLRGAAWGWWAVASHRSEPFL